jgi:hypothetical protein
MYAEAAPILPPDVMAAASSVAYLRITVVIGAGCFAEQPMDVGADALGS